MNKQDRQGVRTALDLERKYNFSGMEKAVKLNKEGLNRMDKTLNDFVQATVGSLDSLEGLIDGNITTYYWSGVPTLGNYPANEWENYAEHMDDFYYDRDTGFAYTFTGDGENYYWERTEDRFIIKVLALANASNDTADSKRRVFTSEPHTPYENGDLWFRDGEIYICQISKGSAEVYENGDFIIATKYTDDTAANKVGEELEVVKGTVLTIKESADQFEVTVEQQHSGLKGEIEVLTNSIKNLITGMNGETLMTQTDKGWSFSMSNMLKTLNDATLGLDSLTGKVEETDNNINEMAKVIADIGATVSYINIGEDENGHPRIELGENDSPYKLFITNTDIRFMDGTTVVAYINNQTLFVNKARIETELQIGGFALVKRSNGNVGFIWRGE